jgi:predicted DNA binding CopG/RHH family protein
MKSNYDFSNAVKNPYTKKLKKTICINISESVLAYFKELAEKTGIPYQTLINMFLTQAKAEKMEPKFIAKPPRKKQVA